MDGFRNKAQLLRVAPPLFSLCLLLCILLLPLSGCGKEEEEKNVDVYNLQGIKLRDNVPASQATDGLPQGIYVVGTQKVVRL